MEVEEGKVAKKSGSAESVVTFGQGKIRMEMKRSSVPEGEDDREYVIKVSLENKIRVECSVHSYFIGSFLGICI